MLDKNWLLGRGIHTLATLKELEGKTVLRTKQSDRNLVMLLEQDSCKFLFFSYAHIDQPHISRTPLLTVTDAYKLGIIDHDEYRVLLRAELNDTDLTLP